MNFLVDAQLPKSLSNLLNYRGHNAIHTLDLPLNNATPDSEIIKLSSEEQRIVINKG